MEIGTELRKQTFYLLFNTDILGIIPVLRQERCLIFFGYYPKKVEHKRFFKMFCKHYGRSAYAMIIPNFDSFLQLLVCFNENPTRQQ